MLLQEILQSKEAYLPASLNNQYSLGLKAKLDGYINLLNSFTLHSDPQKSAMDQKVKSAIPEITDISNEIMKAIEQYYKNNHRGFYDLINAIICKYKTDFDKLISKAQDSNAAKANPEFRFIRARKTESSGKLFSSQNMFHIPKSKRHLCKTYRYSSPGIPGLYMGASSYICWEELKRPNLSELQFVEFRIRPHQSICILDLGYNPALIGRWLKGNTGYYTMFETIVLPRIIWWPLICASSIKTHFSEGSFIEEYIIPQFLLQDPKRNYKYDGIRYFSSRVNYNIYNSLINTCYAFTAEDLDTDEYSPHLKTIFKISEILDCNIVGAVNDMAFLGPLGNRKGSIDPSVA